MPAAEVFISESTARAEHLASGHGRLASGHGGLRGGAEPHVSAAREGPYSDEDALEVQAEGAGGRRTRNTIQVEKKDGGEHDFAGE